MMRQSVAVGEGLEGNNGWNPFLASAAVGGSGQWIKAAGGKKKTEGTFTSAESTNKKWGVAGVGSVTSPPKHLPSVWLPGAFVLNGKSKR